MSSSHRNQFGAVCADGRVVRQRDLRAEDLTIWAVLTQAVWRDCHNTQGSLQFVWWAVTTTIGSLSQRGSSVTTR